MARVALMLLTGTEGGEGAKAYHALLFASQLHEAGQEVQLILDGAGTGWLKKWASPENRLHGLYQKVKALGLIAGACDFCAGHYSDKELVQTQGLCLLGEAEGHPDIAGLVKEGYQLLIL